MIPQIKIAAEVKPRWDFIALPDLYTQKSIQLPQQRFLNPPVYVKSMLGDAVTQTANTQ